MASDGTRVDGAPGGTTDQDLNRVTCTAFTSGGVPTPVGAAVVGSADDGAVTDDDGTPSPEGAAGATQA